MRLCGLNYIFTSARHPYGGGTVYLGYGLGGPECVVAGKKGERGSEGRKKCRDSFMEGS